jgi:two-component system, OmpR family, sensor histidine kinase KdpD
VAAATEGMRDQLVDVRLTVDPDVPEIRADAAQLERAFANLLENAARYGGGTPVVIHARRSAGRDRVLISIVDRGPGIASAEQERIFEPFYRGRSATASQAIGSGLGLAIVKGFVEANGGSITVESLPGQGTSFIVSLPVAEHAGRDEPAEISGAAS